MEQEQRMQAEKVWESVKFYAVRCAQCSKWRLIPSKDKYEEIRAKIGEKLIQCETAREWRPKISCEDEADVEQDGSFMWAMDKPRIPQTPPGWQRILRMRAEGGSKFADVYYVSPSNKRFRSMVELSRYLDENPRYLQDSISTSQFSFQPPVPLDEKYIARRQSHSSGTPLAGAYPVSKSQNDSRGGSESATTMVAVPDQN